MNLKKLETVKAALRRCMYTEGSCPADCPGYEMCITEGAEIMTEGAKAMDVMEGRVRMLAEGLAGTRRVYLYFATKAPIDAAKLPEDGYIAHVSHEERKYIRLIDDMAYGTVIYGRRLAPWEIVKLRLTSAPRE